MHSRSSVLLTIFLVVLMLFSASCQFSNYQHGGSYEPSRPHGTPDPPIVAIPDETNGSGEESGGETEEESAPDTSVDTQPETEQPTSPEDPNQTQIQLDEDGRAEWVLYGETGTKLKLIAKCVAVYSEEGEAMVTVSLYLNHWQLSCAKKRNCTLTVADQRLTYDAEAIRHTEAFEMQTLLATLETVVGIGESFTIEASYPYNGTYSSVSINGIAMHGVFCLA